jgi:hypothetical protein
MYFKPVRAVSPLRHCPLSIPFIHFRCHNAHAVVVQRTVALPIHRVAGQPHRISHVDGVIVAVTEEVVIASVEQLSF